MFFVFEFDANKRVTVWFILFGFCAFIKSEYLTRK